MVTLKDGSAIADEIAVADAHPLGARPFKRPDYIRKFRTLAEGVIAPAEQDRFLDGGRTAADAEAEASCTALNFTVDPAVLAQGRRRAFSTVRSLTTSEHDGMTRSDDDERSTPVPAMRPRKSVALSGVVAGNTALCTVGRTGNDLHYRGYDILDIAEPANSRRSPICWSTARCRRRPNWPAYKTKLRALRGLPAAVKRSAEALPAAAHPMDVMRTGVSALGCVLPEKRRPQQPPARATSPTG